MLFVLIRTLHQDRPRYFSFQIIKEAALNSFGWFFVTVRPPFRLSSNHEWSVQGLLYYLYLFGKSFAAHLLATTNLNDPRLVFGLTNVVIVAAAPVSVKIHIRASL